MASRMERYYKPSKQLTKRTQMNQDLYQEIYKTSEYSNIEGIATIEKSNEVNITKIKNMLKNREEYKKQKDLRSILYKDKEIKENEPVQYEKKEEHRTYDISDVLTKAKTNKKPDDKYRKLGNTNYDILKSLRVKGDSNKEDKTSEIEQTLVDTRVLKSLKDSDLSLDLLDDLKSNTTTMVGSNHTIHQLLEEAKEEELRKKEREKKPELDTSFFTSSLSFGKDDFEEVNGELLKKDGKVWIKRIIIGTILVAITILVIATVYALIK